MASRTTIQLQLHDEVASLLHARAAEANVGEGEIVERALRAFDLRVLVGEVRGPQRSRRGCRCQARRRGTEGRACRAWPRYVIRVVADANVLVSAALARSPQAPPILVFDAALDQRLQLVTSPMLLAEIAAVLSGRV